MILYWALIVELCRCSLTEPTWLYRSESSGDDGWSVDDVFPGLYTTDKDGLSTLSIPPHALESTLAYHPLESTQECRKSLLSNDASYYFVCEGAEFNLSPDQVYQVKWAHELLSESVPQHIPLEASQRVENPSIAGFKTPKAPIFVEPVDAALTLDGKAPEIKKSEDDQLEQVLKPCSGESCKLCKPRTAVIPTTDPQPKKITPLPSMAQLLSPPNPDFTAKPISDQPAARVKSSTQDNEMKNYELQLFLRIMSKKAISISHARPAFGMVMKMTDLIKPKVSVANMSQPNAESVPRRLVRSPHEPFSGTTSFPKAIGDEQFSFQENDPRSYELQSSSYITSGRMPTPSNAIPAIGMSLEMADLMKLEELQGRTVWFLQNQKPHSLPYTAKQDTMPPITFAQWHYYGVLTPRDEPLTQLSVVNTKMGCKIAHGRILFLDGLNSDSQVKKPFGVDWRAWDLNETTLKVENFKDSQLLKEDGLVVALQDGPSDNPRMLMASYGKAPLGAILLHPEGDQLVFVARTFDDTVKSVDVTNGDIVVVGPLLGISNLVSKTLLLSTSDTLDAIATKVYGLAKRSLCVVARISFKKGTSKHNVFVSL